MGNCCTAPAAWEAHETVLAQYIEGGEVHGQQQERVPPLHLAGGGGGDGPLAHSEMPQLSARSIGWFSTMEGGLSDREDEWHDALSEVDLAEALEAWEEEQQWHDAGVDQAIQVLKAHRHLLPADFEVAVGQQDVAAEQLVATIEGPPRVHVAAVPSGIIKLESSRSQHLRSALHLLGVQEQLAEAADLATQGRILGAAAALQAAAETAGSSVGELATLPADAVAAALPAGASLDIRKVKYESGLVREALEALEDHSGWMVSRNDTLKVYYRHQRGTTVHSLKFRALFDHPLEHLLALAHEFDLIPTWNKFSLAAIVLAESSLFESFLYGAQWMMKPFKHMQALLRARGFDLAQEHRCLLVCLEDVTLEELPQGHKPVPPEFGGRKLVNFLPGSCVKIRPLPSAPDGTPRTEGSLMIHMDPHIPYIPAFLLNFVLGVLAPYVFNQMQRVLEKSFADPDGEYCRRIATQQHLYGLARRRMDEYAEVLETEAAEASVADVEARDKKRWRGRTAGSSP